VPNHRRYAVLSVLAAGGLAAMGAVPALASGTHPGVRHVSHATRKGTLITTRHISLGRVLTNSKGRVMYLFTHDTRNVSHCTGTCLALWPRVTSPAKPRAGSGVRKSHLGRIKHNQVTYYGHPLYYFTGDTSGKAKGEGVNGFFVVSTSGHVIKPKPKSTGSGTTVSTHLLTGTSTEVLTTSTGLTLYSLVPVETPGFACTASCTSFWPPLLTTAAPVAAGDTIQADLGTVARPGGGTQVTYLGYPLYTYVGDSAAGQGHGQGVVGPSSDTWYEDEPLYGPNSP
jgi:predicted lipoprotein with Yx(FWY)xxD motif